MDYLIDTQDLRCVGCAETGHTDNFAAWGEKTLPKSHDFVIIDDADQLKVFNSRELISLYKSHGDEPPKNISYEDVFEVILSSKVKQIEVKDMPQVEHVDIEDTINPTTVEFDEAVDEEEAPKKKGRKKKVKADSDSGEVKKTRKRKPKIPVESEIRVIGNTTNPYREGSIRARNFEAIVDSSTVGEAYKKCDTLVAGDFELALIKGIIEIPGYDLKSPDLQG